MAAGLGLSDGPGTRVETEGNGEIQCRTAPHGTDSIGFLLAVLRSWSAFTRAVLLLSAF